MFRIISLTSTAVTSSPTPVSGLASLMQLVLPLGLMFALMYFLMIRPQKKKEKALRDLIDSMTVGDKCMTNGGIVGKVVNIKDDEVTIQTSVANTLITLKKSAISSVSKPFSSDE
jgi:preprotein translocase subunit YajC